MTNTHTIIIQGGLGNQLFQIFTLINYCIQNKCNFIFPMNMQDWDQKRFPYWDSFLYTLKEYTRPNEQIDSIIEYMESEFHYNEIPRFTTDIKFNGYFQTELYFKEHFESICKLIGVREKQAMIKSKYNLYDNTIGLHFRMGDYGNPHHHPIIPDTYYINSLNFIINKTKKTDWNIYYACEKDDDDVVFMRIQNIKQHFASLNFIKISNDIDEWKQMLFMSICKHNIIANSSFSWWSAYFNQYNEKIVCYPSLWFGPAKDNFNLKDIYPDKWNKINII